MPEVVILDEQDASVVFTGQWDHLADPVQYKGIGTGSQTAGTTCSFNFTGTSITVITTIVRAGPFSLQFILDGNPTINSTTGFDNFSGGRLSYHDTTFFADNLSDGEHHMVITNTQTTNGINVYLDYFLYTASSKTNMSNVALFVDDRDPSLTYEGNWRLDTADSDFRHTARAADNTSEASLTIPFNGKGIQFYGLINSGAVGDMLLAEFVLDSTLTTTYAPAAQTSDITYNNKLFDSGPLPQTTHTLVVSPRNEHLVWIDYLIVQRDLLSTPTATTSSGSASSQPARANISGSKSLPVGAIVGIVIAVVVALLAAALAFIFWRRRRQPRKPEPEEVIDTYPNITPNVPPGKYTTSGLTTLSPEPGSSQISGMPDPVMTSQMREYEKASRNRLPNPSMISSSEPASPPAPVTHTDSGIRLNRIQPDPSYIAELPPTYTAN